MFRSVALSAVLVMSGLGLLACPGPAVGQTGSDAECAALDVAADAPPLLPSGAHLVDNGSWVLMPEETDPWSTGRDPAKVPCVQADLLVEEVGNDERWMSVNTQNCGYATLSQPLLEDVPDCSTLLVHIWYFKFLAPKETSVGYEIIVTVGDPLLDGGEPLLRVTGDTLPDESGLIYEVVQTKRAYSAGEPVYYHVSNHGQNSWEFIQFRVM